MDQCKWQPVANAPILLCIIYLFSVSVFFFYYSERERERRTTAKFNNSNGGGGIINHFVALNCPQKWANKCMEMLTEFLCYGKEFIIGYEIEYGTAQTMFDIILKCCHKLCLEPMQILFFCSSPARFVCAPRR